MVAATVAERIVIGSRGSRLALAQTEQVACLLRQAWPGLEVVVEPVRTQGDRDRGTPLARLPGTGFFVKELERALLDGCVDLAVHSMKDVPTRVPEGLVVGAAVPQRADPRDCLVTREGVDLEGLRAGATVGTGSPRRRAMLGAARPDLEFVDLRGNVETRLAKLEAGACDAAVLAKAGLERLGLLDRRAAVVETGVMLPAAGQGALGLEWRAVDERVARLVVAADDAPSRATVEAERALVRRLAAGCRTPLGVLGRVDDGGTLALEAWLLAPDGRRSVRRRAEGRVDEAREMGERLAERVAREAAELLGGPAA